MEEQEDEIKKLNEVASVVLTRLIFIKHTSKKQNCLSVVNKAIAHCLWLKSKLLNISDHLFC